MKRTLSLLLSLVMTLSVFCTAEITSYAATKTGTTGDLSWSLDTDTGVLTLSGSGYGANYANSYSSRAPWYTLYRTQIKSVVINEGVKGIGDYSFYNCTNLTSVSFASTVDTIGTCCFRSCTSLPNITLPSNCTWYYKELFLDCTSLVWAVMPSGNSTNDYSGKLPDGTFSGCTSLEEVYVGPNHTALDTKAFYNCSKLRGVIWDSGEITSIGTSALSSVPSSCTFVDSSSTLSSWASSNGFNYSSLSGACSSNTYSSSALTYSFDTDSRKLSFSGSGDMSSTPWSVYHYLIKDISFADVDNTYTISSSAFSGCSGLSTVVFNSTNNGTLTIGNSAFYNCTASTYWLNIPENTVSIGSNAFNNTNFNYVTIASPKLTFGSNAFGSTGYARFFGVADSGTYDFVKAGRTSGYNWYYYCLNDNHNYSYVTTAPSCTEQGYNTYTCSNCDAEPYKTDYTDPIGHSYKYTGTSESFMVYSCSRCGSTDLKLDAIAVFDLYKNAISHDNDNSAYNQSNYSGAADLYTDGYVNAKDFLLISKVVNSIDTSSTKTTLTESTTYQTMEGFGASACWWSQEVGGWSNLDEIIELLYGKENGIGLNIYRYNLAGGSESDTFITDRLRRGEDFLGEGSDINDASTYDWSADANAQKALASAQKANSGLKVTLFSNSAPVSITDNGKAYCSYSATQNLSESNYQAFANYVVNCAEHFIEQGYNVTEVSPINEPEWAWAADQNGYAGQEGCHFTDTAARTFYNNYMVPTLQSSSLNGKVGLSVWESGQLNHSSYWSGFLNKMFSSATAYKSSNSNIRSYVDSLDTHSYWCSTSDRTTVASQISGSSYSAISKVRCTEYCQMTNDGNTGVYDLIQQEGTTNGMGIEYGLAMADIIYQDLTILNAVEWDWWTACSGGIYPDGLVYINYNDHSDVQTAKRLWCLGNFSKFIEDGAVRIAVSAGSMPSTVEQCAFKNPDGSIAIVYINKGDATQFTSVDGYTSFESYVTDESHDLELYQSGSSQGKAIAIPAKSVTTVVVK
ncbi:MAG: glycoside hydrolase [Eubacterium sp.]